MVATNCGRSRCIKHKRKSVGGGLWEREDSLGGKQAGNMQIRGLMIAQRKGKGEQTRTLCLAERDLWCE